jgi:hypothetical protein
MSKRVLSPSATWPPPVAEIFRIQIRSEGRRERSGVEVCRHGPAAKFRVQCVWLNHLKLNIKGRSSSKARRQAVERENADDGMPRRIFASCHHPLCPDAATRFPDGCNSGRFASPRPCWRMVACGITQDAMARYIGRNGIAPKALRRHYCYELDTSLTYSSRQLARPPASS